MQPTNNIISNITKNENSKNWQVLCHTVYISMLHHQRDLFITVLHSQVFHHLLQLFSVYKPIFVEIHYLKLLF